MIPVLPHEDILNIVPAACDIFQRIHIGLISLASNILTLMKPIKILIALQSILLGVIIDYAIIIMVLSRILTLFLHIMCHGHYQGDELDCRQQ